LFFLAENSFHALNSTSKLLQTQETQKTFQWVVLEAGACGECTECRSRLGISITAIGKEGLHMDAGACQRGRVQPIEAAGIRVLHPAAGHGFCASSSKPLYFAAGLEAAS
jgi:chloramphenicol 3-O-phosphotransferase